MRVGIQEDDADRLVSAISRGVDPLGIGGTSRRTVSEAAADLLSGVRPVPEEASLSKIDEVGVAILAHMGIHPVAVAALAQAANGIGFEDGDGRALGEALTDMRPAFEVTFDGLTWNGDALSIPRLPDTVRALIPTSDEFGDLPLERVVSHPALDPLRIEIWDQEDDKRDAGRMLLHLSSMSRPQTRREMDLAWSEACRRRRMAETERRGEKP